MPKKKAMKTKKSKPVKRKAVKKSKGSKRRSKSKAGPGPKIKYVLGANRPEAPAPLRTATQPAVPKGKPLGEVEDYFSRISVIAITLKDSLTVGDTIHVHGHTTDFKERVESMQISHEPVTSAKKGDSVGIKVGEKCRKGDDVYRV